MKNQTKRWAWLLLLLAAAVLFSGCKVEFPQDRPTESSSLSAQSLPQSAISTLPEESSLPQAPSQPDGASLSSQPANGGESSPASSKPSSPQSKAPQQPADGSPAQSQGSSSQGGGEASAPSPGAPKTLTCTLSIRCDNILKHMDLLDPARREFVPASGVIYAARQVTFQEGESVYDVLKREADAAGIPLTKSGNALFKTIYITSIQNLREKDCGETGGWMYRVNGQTPGMSCAAYQLKDGDRVEWDYTVVKGDVGVVEGSE